MSLHVQIVAKAIAASRVGGVRFLTVVRASLNFLPSSFFIAPLLCWPIHTSNCQFGKAAVRRETVKERDLAHSRVAKSALRCTQRRP
jgi:hypothetical protein